MCIRDSYKTVEGKYRAVIEQVMECHKNGQPVLVGTVSVEKSETLAKDVYKRQPFPLPGTVRF